VCIAADDAGVILLDQDEGEDGDDTVVAVGWDQLDADDLEGLGVMEGALAGFSEDGDESEDEDEGEDEDELDMGVLDDLLRGVGSGWGRGGQL